MGNDSGLNCFILQRYYASKTATWTNKTVKMQYKEKETQGSQKAWKVFRLWNLQH